MSEENISYVLVTPEQMYLICREHTGTPGKIIEVFSFPDEKNLQMIKNRYYNPSSETALRFVFLPREVLLRPSLSGNPWTLGSREEEFEKVFGKGQIFEYFHQTVHSVEFVFRLPAEQMYGFRSVFPAFHPEHAGVISVPPAMVLSVQKGNVCMVRLFGNYLELILAAGGKLKVYNVREILSEEDVLYFTMHAIKVSETDPLKIPVYLLDPEKRYSGLNHLLKNYLGEVHYEECWIPEDIKS